MFIIVKNLKLDNKQQWNSFSYILDAFKEQKHLIWIDSRNLNSARENKDFISFIGDKGRSIIEKLLEIGDEFQQVMEFVSCYLTIDFSDNNNEIGMELLQKEGISVYSISYKEVTSSDILRETKLFAENDEDCTIYQEFGKIYLERRPIFQKLQVQADCVGGGGSTTAHFVRMELKKNKGTPVLCIADADIEYPNQVIANDKTAKKLLDIYDQYRQEKVLHVHVIDARYIENLMPYYISKEIFPYSELGLAHEPQNEKYRLFIDKKQRITLGCMRKTLEYVDSVEEQTQFLREFLQFYTNKLNGDSVALSLDDKEKLLGCLNNKRPTTFGFLKNKLEELDSLAEKGIFLREFLQSYVDEPDEKLFTLLIYEKDRLSHYLETIKNEEIRPLLIQDDTSMWNKVAKYVFSWCLSHKLC